MNCASTSPPFVPPATTSAATSGARSDTTRAANRPKSRREPRERRLRQAPAPPLGPPCVFASDSFRDHSMKSSPASTPEYEATVVCPISELFRCPIEVELYFPPRAPLNSKIKK